MAQVRVGISGWTYAPWRGTFYPSKLPHARELAYAASVLNSIEINGTFYRLQTPAAFQSWHDQTPDDFVFSVKAGRFITHLKRLRDVETALANFWACGLLKLKGKLGPILWQLPPNFVFEAGRLESFFRLLPRTTSDAAQAARGHEARLSGRVWVETDRRRALRHAIEVRHESFRDPAFVELLRRHRVALVVADTAGKWPLMEDVTADFVYVRLHGDKELYVSGYDHAALDTWAAKIRAWSAGSEAPGTRRVGGPATRRKSRDVFVYFDNDVKVRAPFDAASLALRLGVRNEPLEPISDLGTVRGTARRNWPGMRRPQRRAPSGGRGS